MTARPDRLTRRSTTAMTTTIKPKRIQRQRTKGWRMPENTVYVGRPTRWGNPFRAGVDFCGPTIRCLYSPAELVAQYRTWATADTLNPLFWDAELVTAHVALKVALTGRVLAGKDLACWCPLDQPCHADVLLEIANAPAETVPSRPHVDEPRLDRPVQTVRVPALTA